MTEITQLVIALVLSFLLGKFLKPYLLRKWLGVGMVAALLGRLQLIARKNLGGTWGSDSWVFRNNICFHGGKKTRRKTSGFSVGNKAYRRGSTLSNTRFASNELNSINCWIPSAT